MTNTSPIERLNYFNGQRLEAADFRVEQDFHIRVRRLLNQSLFTAGIAAGLEVDEVPPRPSRTLVVSPGVALDFLGREIILVEPRKVPVAGKPTDPADPVTGNYLVTEYAEETTAFAGDGCAVQLGVTCKATEDLAWGAPSRVRAEPRIYIQHQWPKATDNKIVLAQLELQKDCSVRRIRTFVRKYAMQAKPAAVAAFALEGEKDLDKHNSKELFFHIEGGRPNRATLYLRAAKFSTLFYTELGKHNHDMDFTSLGGGVTEAHSHSVTLGELATTEDGMHRHEIHGCVANPDEGVGIEVDPGGVDDLPLTGPGGVMGGRLKMEVFESGKHTHKLAAGPVETSKAGGNPAHTHPIHGATKDIGIDGGVSTRTIGAPHTFVSELRVKFDKDDITNEVIAQLNARDGGGWTQLGDGTAGHKLTLEGGTREIDLLRLDVDLAPGQHRLEFSVGAGGGKIQYNLYIA